MHARETRIIYRYIDREKDDIITMNDFRLFVRNLATDVKVEKLRLKIVKHFKTYRVHKFLASNRFIVFFFIVFTRRVTS